MYLKKPLRCTYKTKAIPDTYEGDPINDNQFNNLFVKGLIEKDIIYNDALILRLDNTPLTDVASGLNTAQMQALIVNIDNGEMSTMAADTLILDDSSIKYLVELSEPNN